MRPLSLDQQRRLICARFERAKVCIREHRSGPYLTCDVPLRPTESSPSYLVRVVYLVRNRPWVVVLDPKPVTAAHGVRTPHLNGDGTLCLFDPHSREWKPTASIADTTLPWTVRWLFHYEHWLVFGDWLGDPPNRLHPGAAPTALIGTGGAAQRKAAEEVGGAQ